MNKTITYSTIFSLLFLAISVSAQPLLIKEIPANSSNFASANGQLFFFSGDSLYKSNATSGGTVFVKEINGKVTSDKKLTLGNFLYFTASEPGKTAIWKTDGTAANTVKLGSFVAATPLLVYKNEIYYALDNGVTGIELWKLNASNAFTLLKDIIPGNQPGFGHDVHIYSGESIIISNNMLYFRGNASETESNLWKSDGTPAGTVMAVDIPTGYLGNLTDVNGTIYFTIRPETYYNFSEIWKTNGTPAGTSLVKKFTEDIYYLYNFISFKNKLYFFNNYGDWHDELWVCDGTETGTKKIKGVGIDSDVMTSFVTDNHIVFTIQNQGAVPGIWKSDGTTVGTEIFAPTTNSYWPGEVVKSGNLVFYTEHDGPSFYGNADNGEDQYQLFQSGYDTTNSKAVRKIFGAGQYMNANNITDVNGKIFFATITLDPNSKKVIKYLYYYDPTKPAVPAPYFTLINADTDKDIAWLRDGDTIAKPQNMNINIRYNPVGAIGSVVFKLSDTTRRVESGAPYALAGDNNGNYSPWLEAKSGKHKLTAIPYSQSNAQGTAGAPLTVNFYIQGPVVKQAPIVNAGQDQTIYLPKDSTVLSATATDPDGRITYGRWGFVSGPTDTWPSLTSWDSNRTTAKGLSKAGTYIFSFEAEDNDGNIGYDEMQVIVKAAPSGPRVDNFTLINADNDQNIKVINDGEVIYLGNLPSQSLNIKINTTPASLGKVVIQQNGTSRTETVAPYSVYGDNNGNFSGVTFAPGFYTLTATPYTSTGAAGAPLTIHYEVKAGRPNQAPVADAGPDMTVYSTNENKRITIIGKSSDPDGTIVYKNWNQITAQPYGYVTNQGDTMYADLPAYGRYVFRFTVTDNSGASAEDEVVVTMEYGGNQAPVADAGPDRTLYLPANSITINGSSVDTDGTVGIHKWIKISGPSVIMNGTNSPSLQLSNMTEGVYSFRYTVTDNAGDSDSDEVTVTVHKQDASLVTFTLMNADTDEPIRDISTNETLDIKKLPTSNLNIRINVNINGARSVRMVFDGASRAENTAPYSLFGDNNGNYIAGQFSNGAHTLTAMPYSGSVGTGTMLASVTLKFNVINGSSVARMGAWENESSGITLSAYPNPVEDIITISTTDELSSTMLVKIMDSNGREFYSERNSLTGKQLSIDVSQLDMKPGIYILRVEPTHSEATSLKIVKK